MASAKVFFPVSWIDVFNQFDMYFRGILITHIMKYSEGEVVSDLSEVDSVLSAAWQHIKQMIDTEKIRTEAISAARKLAGSLGGKKRAMKYHKPDGSNRSVPLERKEAVHSEGVQEHLYAAREEQDAEKGRASSVRVLPAPKREQVFVSRPVKIVKNVISNGFNLLKAVGDNVSTMMVPVMATNEGFMMPSLFSVPVVNDDSSYDGGSLFDMPVASSGNGIYPDDNSDKADDDSKKPKSKKKRVSRKKMLNVPPKSKDLIDKTPARRYGEYENVILTDKQYETLQKEFPDTYEEYIRRCDEYCERTHKEYTNYLMTIRNWVRKDRARGVYGKPNAGDVAPGYAGNGQPRFVSRPEDRPFFQSSDIELDAKNHEALAEFERMNQLKIEEMRRKRMAEAAAKAGNGSSAELDGDKGGGNLNG